MPQLHFSSPDRDLFTVVLKSGRTVIGRADHCDIALPSEAVSRVHCVVERDEDTVRLVDRSRNGTEVNGALVTEAMLCDGDVIGLAEYRIRFAAFEHPDRSGPTSSRQIGRDPMPYHEELVAGDEQGIASEEVQMRFVQGPRTGEVTRMATPVVTLGGPGSSYALDEQLPPKALRVHVVRGRPMVEAGTAAVFLSGVRVRTRTPVLPGEEIRVGTHGFVLERATVEHDVQSERFGQMVGASPVVRKLFGALARMAVHDQPVLLIGESGTGKELAARGLHDEGLRHDGPFVALNCAAVAPTLFESELFGHEKGSFTGADARSDGAFHRADGGTLFLDEIGELAIELQAKLLRVLESGEVRRVGGGEPTFPDVRVVAATNRKLGTMIEAGTFRADLYWRLAVLTIRLPSLRERPTDIPLLARTLLDQMHPNAPIEPEAMTKLAAHRWPGNVRELRSVLTRALVMNDPPLTAHAIRFDPWGVNEPATEPADPPAPADSEAHRLSAALAEANGNRSQAARRLGMPRSTLLYKLVKYNLGT